MSQLSFTDLLQEDTMDEDILSPSESKLLDDKIAALKKQEPWITSDDLTKFAVKFRSEIKAARGKDQNQGAYPIKRDRSIILPDIVPIIKDEKMAPYNNMLAKSSIFAPRKPGPREDTGTEWIDIPCPRGVQLRYNGPLLDMKDQTLFLVLAKCAAGKAPNEIIMINRARLLKACGHSILGSSAYKWLNESFDRLIQANIQLTVDNAKLERPAQYASETSIDEQATGRKRNRVNYKISLLSELKEDVETGQFYFRLPPSILALFAGRMFGYNDLEKRRQLLQAPRGDLAAWLQSYIAADGKGEHAPILVKTLHTQCGSRSRINDFTARLKIAFNGLSKAGIVDDFTFLRNESKQLMVKWVTADKKSS